MLVALHDHCEYFARTKYPKATLANERNKSGANVREAEERSMIFQTYATQVVSSSDKVLPQLYTIYLGVALNFWYPLMTLFTASRKSFSVTVFLLARMAYIPASVQTLLISAPKQKGVKFSGGIHICKKTEPATSQEIFYFFWKLWYDKGSTKQHLASLPRLDNSTIMHTLLMANRESS